MNRVACTRHSVSAESCALVCVGNLPADNHLDRTHGTCGEVSSGRHADILDTSLAVGANAADSVPLIVIYSIVGVMVGSFIAGGGIMIMARATRDYLYDKIERQREKLREEGREALAAEIEAWNLRRLEAERRGEPFDEPPPSA